MPPRGGERTSDQVEADYATRGGRREPGVGIQNDRVLDGRSIGDMIGPFGNLLLNYPLGAGAEAYEKEKQAALNNPKFRAVHNAVVSILPKETFGRFAIDDTTSPYNARNAPAFRRGLAGGDLYPPVPKTRVPGMTPHVTTDEGNFQVAPSAQPQRTTLPQPPIPPAPRSTGIGSNDGVGEPELPSDAGRNVGYKFPIPQLVEPDVLPTKERVLTVPSDGTNIQNTLHPPKPKVVGPADVQHTSLTGSGLTPDEQRIRNSNTFDFRELFGGYYGGGSGGGGNGLNDIAGAY